MKNCETNLALAASQVTAPESPEDWLLEFIYINRPELITGLENHFPFILTAAQAFHRKKLELYGPIQKG